jgi:hypothetical protein
LDRLAVGDAIFAVFWNSGAIFFSLDSQKLSRTASVALVTLNQTADVRRKSDEVMRLGEGRKLPPR